MKIKKIIKEVLNKVLFENNFNQNIENYLINKYEIDLFLDENNEFIELFKIIVPENKRGAGIGTVVMKDLIKYAKLKNKDIFLTPSADFGGNKKQLEKFYKNLGFVFNKGRNKDYRSSHLMVYKV
jgi:predicted GNAT superfamily acetyltransferase